MVEYEITSIFLQKEWTKEETTTLSSVKQSISSKIKFVESYDQFLIHPEDIPFESFNTIPKVFTQFRKKIEKYVKVREPFDKPNILPKKNLIENKTKVPTLQNLGFKAFDKDSRSAFPFQGGETGAWERLNHYFWKTHQLQDYKKTRKRTYRNRL